MPRGIFTLEWDDFLQKARRFESGNKVCWIEDEGNELKAILVSGLCWGCKITTNIEEKKETLEDLGFVVAKKVPSYRF